MYIYNVGYGSFEESEHIQLFHKKKFTQKKFENIVIEATISVLKEDYVKCYKELKQKDDDNETKVTFQDIFYSVVEVLIKKFGFKKVKFEGKFNVFGWADILNNNDWKNDRGKQLNKLTKSARKKLM